MAGGILRALYSGTRGLDLGPTKLRLDERYRNQQLAEDMRRALAGEKIQESELALRQSALAQQKDSEAQKMALERELAGQRMGIEQRKLGLDEAALAGYLNGQPTIDRAKLTAATTSDIPPWQKNIALWQAIAGAKKAGINLRLNDKGELELAPEQPKPEKPPAPTEEKDEGGFWGNLWERVKKAAPEGGADPEGYTKKIWDRIKQKWEGMPSDSIDKKTKQMHDEYLEELEKQTGGMTYDELKKLLKEVEQQNDASAIRIIANAMARKDMKRYQREDAR